MIPIRGWVVVALATAAVWSVLAHLPAAPEPKIKKFTSDYQLILKSDGRLEAVRSQQETAEEQQVPVRDRKSDRLDLRHAEQPYFGRVLPFDISKVI